MSGKKTATGAGRSFLFLQGPHGPFFSQLGNMIGASGATVTRVGFNAGDQAFWSDSDNFVAFREPLSEWPTRLSELVSNNRITDLVLYGDTRPIHAKAISIAKDIGLTVHVFEEGYLRPFWITYERGGSNGNSRLMDMSVGKMRCQLSQSKADAIQAPDHWGDMREHVFYGAVYHWFLLFRNRKYRNFKSHRSIGVGQEFKLHLKRLLLMPAHWGARIAATRRIKSGGFPYHLALLQLEHDSSFQSHSPFSTMNEFLQLVIESFAKGAPTHHHLVFKAHPLEDGRVPIEDDIWDLAVENGVEDRVHFLRGGKLAGLLDAAQSAVSVNSTAIQQALWRGLPVKSFGDAVYNKPEFVSEQPLADFFKAPTHPDTAAYRDYRHFLLETSQVTGGFYAARSRRQLLRNVVDMMLRPCDPYDALKVPTAAPAQQLRVVK